ncbi:ATP-binding protein [Natronomonas amylolytica]|uniref:ATP-binding protein n=1 Tax=Natronomonas amylolytica TaxID=3108498 RepID=UPI0030088EFE
MRKSPSSIPVVGRVVDAVRSSFRWKLAAALLAVFVVISLVTVGLYVQVGALIEENVEQSMASAATAEAEELDEWNGQNRLVTRVLSEHPVYETGNRTSVRAYLRAQRENREEAHIVRAYVIDRQNQTVATSTDRELAGTTVRGLPWEERFAFRDFDAVQLTRPYRVGNRTVVGFITPIRPMPGRLLVVEFDTAGVFERFEHPVDGGFTRVVDSNGTVVFADDGAATLTQYREGSARAPIVSSGLRGESGFTESPVYDSSRSEAYVAAYAPVAGTDWVVVEHAPESEAYVILRQARTWIGGIAVFALVGLLGVVAVLGADVTGALSALTERAKRIEAEEYDVEFDTDRPDEFGDLNRTLASTRDTLQRRIEEIRRTKEELEDSNAALEERSSMVTVLNRILRHNVRNDVNVITGRAELATSRTDDEAVTDDLEAIQQAAWELVDISESTQRIKQLIAETNEETTCLQLEEYLRPALDEVETSAPEADVRVDADEALPTAEATSTLPIAVADVVDQIVDHTDGAVTVEVTVTTAEPGADGDERVALRVDDDGDGLPRLDVRAVEDGEETPLNHAEGLALWCLEWTVSQADGDLDLSPDDATFEVRLPAEEPPDGAAETAA